MVDARALMRLMKLMSGRACQQLPWHQPLQREQCLRLLARTVGTALVTAAGEGDLRSDSSPSSLVTFPEAIACEPRPLLPQRAATLRRHRSELFQLWAEQAWPCRRHEAIVRTRIEQPVAASRSLETGELFDGERRCRESATGIQHLPPPRMQAHRLPPVPNLPQGSALRAVVVSALIDEAAGSEVRIA